MIRRPRADEGFTMIEVLVAIAIISIVMLSLASYFVVSLRIDTEQGDRQAAIQVADDAMERARAIQPAAILTGRDLTSSLAQWQNPISAVSSLLSTTALTMAYDSTALAGAGASAVLKTTANPVTLNNVVYNQYWYVGTCLRATATAANCLTATAATKFSTYYEVIVGVSWPGRTCPNNLCSFATSSLIGSMTDEPEFNLNYSNAPVVTNPGTQTTDIGVAVALGMTVTGGTSPLTWSATGLPAGVTINATSGAITGSPTAAATYTTVVTVTDAYSRQNYVSFSWVTKAMVVMTAPGTISSQGGAAYTKTFAYTGGATPYTWTAAAGAWGSTGLPPGLSLATSTGIVSGTPTTVGTNNVTLTVTDSGGGTSSQTFSWVVPALAVVVKPPTTKSGTAITAFSPTVTGGIQPYVTYGAIGLPVGISINSSTGSISGTATVKGTYTTVVTVTDTSGTSASSAATSWVVS